MDPLERRGLIACMLLALAVVWLLTAEAALITATVPAAGRLARHTLDLPLRPASAPTAWRMVDIALTNALVISVPPLLRLLVGERPGRVARRCSDGLLVVWLAGERDPGRRGDRRLRHPDRLLPAAAAARMGRARARARRLPARPSERTSRTAARAQLRRDRRDDHSRGGPGDLRDPAPMKTKDGPMAVRSGRARAADRLTPRAVLIAAAIAGAG